MPALKAKEEKKQAIYMLPPALVREIKMAAAERDLFASDIVAQACRKHLKHLAGPRRQRGRAPRREAPAAV